MAGFGYYHMFANGEYSRNFIIRPRDFLAAFNRIGVCAANSNAKVVAFAIEDSHPHVLLYGSEEDCIGFKMKYELSTKRYIAATRGSIDDVIFECELDYQDDPGHLKNVATYVISQPTKDGKAVMPYDYLYGTGALYFRTASAVMPWLVDEGGRVVDPEPVSSLSKRNRKSLLCSHMEVPGDWEVANGFLLPTSYVDVGLFESIYVTHNCYRVFLCSGRQRDQEILNRMASVRGISMEDMEARRICSETCMALFKKDGPRFLTPPQRLSVARTLRKNYLLSFRQIATLVRLPEIEIRSYV